MQLLSKLSAKLGNDDTLREGALVCFEHHAQPVIGVIEGFRKAKHVIFSMRGREIEFEPLRLYPLPGKAPSNLSSNEQKVIYLSGIFERAEKATAQVKIDELWSSLDPETNSSREFKTKELCELSFGNNELVSHLAMRLALLGDKVYFKRTKDGFSPRIASTVEQLKQEAVRAVEKQGKMDQLSSWFLSRLEQKALPIPTEFQEFITLLEDVAVEHPQLSHQQLREARELLDLCAEKLPIEKTKSESAPLKKRAFALLEAINHFTPYTNLSLLRYRCPIEFGDAVLRDAHVVESKFSGVAHISAPEDLSHLECITIDDASTKDMDDALSVEITDTGYRLGVHISDVASAIPHNSSLEHEAATRATSIYCPDRTINMLPDCLSENALSLVEGQPRQVLSFLFDIDRSFNVVSGNITHSKICVKKRLTYEQAAELLEKSDHQLGIIYNITMSNAERRLQGGAQRVAKREVLAIVKDKNQAAQDEFELYEVDEDDPARSLVAETAVMTNAFVAEYAQKKQLAMIFRSQEAPQNERTQPNNVPEGPARDLASRMRLKKSLISTRPLPHATLGIKAYLQITSPIRRYLDLINQRQLLNYIKSGTTLYKPAELEALIEKVEPALSTANLVSRETKRFWMLKFIEKLHQRRASIKATVVRTDGRTPIVELDQVFIQVPVKLERKVTLGETLELEIHSVNPQDDSLRLAEKR